MPDLEKVVGGLSCREVLGDLSDLEDGTLADERMDRIRAHVAGCDTCERFGGRFAAVVSAVRRELADEPAELHVFARIRAGLRDLE